MATAAITDTSTGLQPTKKPGHASQYFQSCYEE